ncbi:early light-induced protein 1, chloroplastic-like isoform X3 [Rhododendron vialii]|uniref:early light-induced protein 1, chloroplastic-like isoform X3 n=1 Tax=Rhododendron vialii TaxID=182163 RepID=UPI00265E784E|nr:early light-induced protein 1, chloroplastic-like isoform X3 [Rhododendron vialii]
MATSSVMQFILVSPVTGVAKGAGLSPTIPRSCYLPRQGRNSGVLVRCMAKVRTDFFNLLAFSGPGPERINGRLAMVGFVAAIAVELSKGEDVFAQISNGGIPWFLLTTGVLSVASLIPLSSGVSVESKSKPFWSSDAEMWNGRFAMLGLVALALTEFVKGGALV